MVLFLSLDCLLSVAEIPAAAVANTMLDDKNTITDWY